MKKTFSVKYAAVTVFMFLMLFLVPRKADAAIRTYTIQSNNTRVYSDTSLKKGYGWIYGSDEVTVSEITQSYCKVTYPVSRGTKTGYVSTSALFLRTTGKSGVARARVITYRRPGSASYGYIAKGDTVVAIETLNNFTQVRYPVKGGYKFAFIKNSDYNAYIKAQTNNESANQNSGNTDSVGKTNSSSANSAVRTYYVTTKAGLILRSKASVLSLKILKMPYSASFKVTSTSGSFAYGTYNGRSGYASLRYLSTTRPSTASTVKLNVPVYRQFDRRWGSTKLGTKTIKQVGCTTTCLAMKYSYQTGTATWPDKMRNKLSYSNNDIQWSSVTKLGYSISKQYKCKISQKIMQFIYQQLKNNKPVIIGGTPSAKSNKQHWVVVTGYTGSGTGKFSASDFTIIDPNSSARTTLKAFLNYKPYVYKLVY